MGGGGGGGGGKRGSDATKPAQVKQARGEGGCGTGVLHGRELFYTFSVYLRYIYIIQKILFYSRNKYTCNINVYFTVVKIIKWVTDI